MLMLDEIYVEVSLRNGKGCEHDMDGECASQSAGATHSRLSIGSSERHICRKESFLYQEIC